METTGTSARGGTARRWLWVVAAAVAGGSLIGTLVAGGEVSDLASNGLGAVLGVGLVSLWMRRRPRDVPDSLQIADRWTLGWSTVAHGDLAIAVAEVTSDAGCVARLTAGSAGGGALKMNAPGEWDGASLLSDRGIGSSEQRVRRASGGTVLTVRRVARDTFEVTLPGAAVTFTQPRRGDLADELASVAAQLEAVPDELATLVLAYVASRQARWLA